MKEVKMKKKMNRDDKFKGTSVYPNTTLRK